MTWTYTPGWLSTSGTTGNMTRVRLIVGDTETTDQQLQDEEIYWILTITSTMTYAGAACADLLAAKYARQVNTENSALRVTAAERHKHYLALAKRLRDAGPGDIPGGEGFGTVLGGIDVGGASRADVEAIQDDSDNILPSFAVGQDDMPGTTQSNNPADWD